MAGGVVAPAVVIRGRVAFGVWRRILLVVLAVVVVLAGLAVWQIGPRNVLGMLMYDQRREGSLMVGDKAPDVTLGTLDEPDLLTSQVAIFARARRRWDLIDASVQSFDTQPGWKPVDGL